MKVVIGSETYDASKMRLAVVLTPQDKANIASMPPESLTVYVAAPKDSDFQATKRWLMEIKHREDPTA